MNIKQYEPLWGTWHLKNVIGGGSCGVVYKAEQEILGHTYTCAVKHFSIPRDEAEHAVVKEQLVSEDNETLKEYYEQEVQSIVNEYEIQKQFVGREHFVLVHDILSIPKTDMPGYDLFIRMELLNTVNSRFHENMTGPEKEKEVIRLGMHICSALMELHANHYVHRDIKPQNILVSDKGVYKLADFGAARQFNGKDSFMSLKGTMDYMAPEVITGQKAGFQADVYSLGIVLYQLLNHHRLPFVSADSDANEKAYAKRLEGELLPAPDEASMEMSKVILKACAYRPEDRFSSAEEMYDALQNAMDAKHAEQEALYQETVSAIRSTGLQSAKWSDILNRLERKELDHYRDVDDLRLAAKQCYEGHTAVEKKVEIPPDDKGKRKKISQKETDEDPLSELTFILYFTVLVAGATLYFVQVPLIPMILTSVLFVFEAWLIYRRVMKRIPNVWETLIIVAVSSVIVCIPLVYRIIGIPRLIVHISCALAACGFTCWVIFQKRAKIRRIWQPAVLIIAGVGAFFLLNVLMGGVVYHIFTILYLVFGLMGAYYLFVI